MLLRWLLTLVGHGDGGETGYFVKKAKEKLKEETYSRMEYGSSCKCIKQIPLVGIFVKNISKLFSLLHRTARYDSKTNNNTLASEMHSVPFNYCLVVFVTFTFCR